MLFRRKQLVIGTLSSAMAIACGKTDLPSSRTTEAKNSEQSSGRHSTLDQGSNPNRNSQGANVTTEAVDAESKTNGITVEIPMIDGAQVSQFSLNFDEAGAETENPVSGVFCFKGDFIVDTGNKKIQVASDQTNISLQVSSVGECAHKLRLRRLTPSGTELASGIYMIDRKESKTFVIPELRKGDHIEGSLYENYDCSETAITHQGIKSYSQSDHGKIFLNTCKTTP